MKKKKTITLIAACMALFAGTQTVCGQSGVLQSSDVNNVFGAGESSLISTGNHSGNVSQPWDIQPAWHLSFNGGYSHAITINSTVKDIEIGGSTAINTVIKTYTGNGFATGWISVLDTSYDGNNPNNQPHKYISEDYYASKIEASYLEPHKFGKINATTWDNKIYEFSFNKFNIKNYASGSWSGGKAPCNSDLFQVKDITPTTATGGCSRIEVYTHIIESETAKHVIADACPSARPSDIYTSTINGYYTKTYGPGYFNSKALDSPNPDDSTYINMPIDDDVALVQFSGSNMTDGLALSNQPKYKLQSDISKPLGDINSLALTTNPEYWADTSKTKSLEYITNYRRPTTLIVSSGDHLFNNIKYNNIYWQYEIDSVSATPTFKKHLSGCGSGTSSAFEFLVEWKKQVDDKTIGATLVDAAVMLEPNANVYVGHNVVDATSGSASLQPQGGAPDNKTDALLIVGDSTSGRFALRVAGDYKELNIVQDTTNASGTVKEQINPGFDGRFYKQGTFPSKSNSRVYLFAGENAKDFTYANSGLLSYNNEGNIDVYAPAKVGKGSVFGVYGSYIYKANNAHIYTAWGDNSKASETITKYDNPGVIEIGSGSAAVGYNYFHIHSGGTLKNFEKMSYINKDQDNDNCIIPTNNFAMNLTTSDNTPEFVIDGKEPLFILNYGSNEAENACAADLNFGTQGIANIVNALGNASDKGALHIQARGDVMFNSAFSPTISKENNELRILSDEASIQFNDVFGYVNNKDSNLVIWAQGKAGDRSCPNETCTGFVYFAQTASIQQDTKGISLVRSEKSNVLMDNTFEYNNKKGPDNTFGEFIMQAGQDIYGKGAVTVTQTGNRPVLFEAKQSVHFANTLTFDRTSAMNGASVIKAGYSNFSKSADVKDWTAPTPICYSDNNNYEHRGNPCSSEDGGDIWFEGPVFSENTTADDSVSTIFRAWNNIYVDNALTYTRDQKSVRDSIAFLMFAETGNIEAIKPIGTVDITTSNANDTTTIRLQAGNIIPDMTKLDDTLDLINNEVGLCDPNQCYREKSAHFDGNILFNKTLDIEHSSLGHTLISASRDIENDQNGKFIFNYNNDKAVLPFYMTAGRHIETHAPVEFAYVADTANITLEAGRMEGNSGCSENLCKVDERGSNLSTSVFTDNQMSKGGAGNGSILMFAPMSFDHTSNGYIYMKALNGDIESDPYLHGSYGAGALLSFDHKGTGVTKMQAIDIRLHDKMDYNASAQATDNKNGQLYILAYDSILTRDITYTNPKDSGSVFIIADKYKRTLCDPSISQGHIVLGYGADCGVTNDIIKFNYTGNLSTTGANVYIKAGYAGFNNHSTKKTKFGGNITFDNIQAIMANPGNRNQGGYMEISTPNGNIWGKDALNYTGYKGDLLVDAGMGSEEDGDAVAWMSPDDQPTGDKSITDKNILNTRVFKQCEQTPIWRTGDIMMKGGTLDFNGENGNATFRTRQGYIDTYDKFDVTNMTGQLLKYAHVEDDSDTMQYSDVSERDFSYAPADGSVYFGADDNIMMNYGNSNGAQKYDGLTCTSTGTYSCTENDLVTQRIPAAYKSQSGGNSDVVSVASFNVNKNGYLWYQKDTYEKHGAHTWMNNWHALYRGGSKSCNNSGIAGTCATPSNGARDLTLPFTGHEGGFAAVANNYIDFFTKVIYNGGSGMGMATPTVGTIVGENVTGYGLFIKSRNQGDFPEKRRITCEDCGTEWPAVTFHDDARIHAENQKVNLEGPVIEFFGHAELDAQLNKGSKTNLVVKGDSLIFHDSAIFDGADIKLLPFTTEGRGMRHGIVNDVNIDFYKGAYRQAITMTDRMLPVLELGYQRCNEPLSSPNKAPNTRSDLGKEEVPTVGGDVIVAVKDGYKLPIFNTVVANHARISFVSDSLDHKGNVYLNAFVRTDLLRIRNKVEFYTGEGTGKNEPKNRVGHFEMTSTDQMVKPTFDDAGMYPKHLHMEPGSELSIPGENTLTAIATTTIGGYGEIHEDVYIKANGTIAPGHSSLMEQDCTSGKNPGMLKIHNLVMDKDAEFRISLGDQTGNNSTGVDTLYVEDTVRFNGKIPLYVLTDVKSVETGCYTFLIYNDKDGVSKEYVKNLVLKIDRYEDNYFSLNYSTPGEVKLCVSKSPNPVVQQYVELPVVEGVTLTPYTGGKHYVVSQQSFTFYATYTGAPLKVMADGVYDGKHVEIFGEKQSDGSYKYILTYVVEPWTVTIGPEFATNFVGNEAIEGNKVWAYKNMLYVNVSESDIASIYTMTGVLYKRVELPEGSSKLTLDKGMYIVTLKDGSVHKIVIK